jgi:hypothetical protein
VGQVQATMLHTEPPVHFIDAAQATLPDATHTLFISISPFAHSESNNYINIRKSSLLFGKRHFLHNFLC